ncbi:hypothetical protein [Nocardia rhizosphaerae]|uniref:DUF5642 domain-containing protein n=1 Tax=Nocardia rhizosphaerae TaxID=1691571 RepID=A0ABV8L7X6_9NOCA
MQRLLLAVAVLVAVVACGPAESPAPYWTVEATTDAEAFEMLRRAAAVEPCALLPRTELAELGEPGPDQVRRPDACEVAVAGRHGRSTVTVIVVAGTFDGAWGVVPDDATTTIVDGAAITTVEDRDMRRERSIPDGDRTCRVDVKYPAAAGYTVSVAMPAGSDPCPRAERLALAAMARWLEQPPHGTTPGLPRSILAGIDPCAVPAALGATIRADEQQLGACSFRLDGTHTAILFDHFPEASFADGPHDERGRYVLPDGPALMKAQLGPAFTTDEENRPIVPAAVVSGDTPVAHRVMNAVIDHFR